MDKKKLGNKLLCPECEVKFYDLGKPEIICPSCGYNISEIIRKEAEEAKKIREKDSDKSTSETEIEKVNESEANEEATDANISVDEVENSISEINEEEITEKDDDEGIDTDNIEEIDELEEFDLDDDIDDDIDDDEFLEDSDDDSVEDVIGSVKSNKEEE